MATFGDRKQTAEEHLNATLRAQERWIGNKGPNSENAVAARNVLLEELGHFKDFDLVPRYDLDEAQRDRLLAHARQDAAHALLNSISLLDEVKVLRRSLRLLGWAAGIGLVLIIGFVCITLLLRT